MAADPLTDSLSASHDVAIRRATLRPRNPENRATSAEARGYAQGELRGMWSLTFRR